MVSEKGTVTSADSGFTVVDVVMAMLVVTIMMTSLTYLMYSGMTDVAYSRQRVTALSLANQAVEEVRALPATTIEAGMNPSGSPDPTWSQDPNVAGACFDHQPLDVNGTKAASTCQTSSWQTPPCASVAGGAPSASSLTSPAPLSPHLSCYSVGGGTYGVAVYLTGDPNALPLTVWAVVWWQHPLRAGLPDHVVTNISLSNCISVGSTCGPIS